MRKIFFLYKISRNFFIKVLDISNLSKLEEKKLFMNFL